MCNHYKNLKLEIYAECCNKFYDCRFCHNENEDHEIDRYKICKIRCKECNKIQDKSNKCIECSIKFSENYCNKCNLWSDKKHIYHCDKCKICRVGLQEDMYHCENCNICFPLKTKNFHKCSKINCIENSCPVCLENLNDNQKSIIIMKCKHPIHLECYKELINNNNSKCPLCKKMFLDDENLKNYWIHIENNINNQSMPNDYKKKIEIYCYECEKKTVTDFHFLGLKCVNCGGYNTIEI